jgi:hypothetical protein
MAVQLKIPHGHPILDMAAQLPFSDREGTVVDRTNFPESFRDVIHDQVRSGRLPRGQAFLAAGRIRVIIHLLAPPALDDQILMPSLPVKRRKRNAAPKSKATWIIVNAAIAPRGE